MDGLICKLSFCLVLCCAIVVADVNAKIYKWVDKNGTVHFSDKPYSVDAEEVNVKRTGIRITGNETSRSKSSKPASSSDTELHDQQSTQSHSSPDDDKITEDDYRVTSNVGKIGADAIRISGRISSGPRCENLAIDAFARSDTGLSATVKTSTRKVTSHGSATFEGIAKVAGSADDFGFWEVESVKIKCIDLP